MSKKLHEGQLVMLAPIELIPDFDTLSQSLQDKVMAAQGKVYQITNFCIDRWTLVDAGFEAIEQVLIPVDEEPVKFNDFVEILNNV